MPRSRNNARRLASAARTSLHVVFAEVKLWDMTTRRNPAQRAARFEERAVERFLSPDERKRPEAELAKAPASPHRPWGLTSTARTRADKTPIGGEQSGGL